MSRINVTKSFLPPLAEYTKYLEGIWSRGQLTNQGPLVKELESAIEEYLNITNLQLVSNGTIALQLALRALGITSGEIITTPFSYVATTSAILWENCTPIFVDIEPDTFCIDSDKIEAAITPETKAILAVHVFGYPCDTAKIEDIAKRHKLKVIYDAAHAFGAEYNGKSLLDYGDISTCSFHATKLFHTVEGGAVIIHDKTVSDSLELIKRFGHEGDNHFMLGINAKLSELHAAMGLCNLKYTDKTIAERRAISELYDHLLGSRVQRPKKSENTKYNYAYYPVLFRSEAELLSAFDALQKQHIFPRRYFYPSLQTLPYVPSVQTCEVSDDISSRIACLPLYPSLGHDTVEQICRILNS